MLTELDIYFVSRNMSKIKNWDYVILPNNTPNNMNFLLLNSKFKKDRKKRKEEEKSFHVMEKLSDPIKFNISSLDHSFN
ncbi:hypothetical protein BpHYR1_020066 [Brachionus plicatilis]|uniref:Uncharacterized protein n=1 Tax=Brachionus plicatilis TaxID=10195 RepID=A0A3M7QYB4_BRAPC|nr:hypothetical protein BpHYR1_020066 [Brachionus plicatilis]